MPQPLDHFSDDASQLSPVFRGRRFIALLLIAITLGTFARLKNCDFLQWDDWSNLVDSKRLNPPTLEGIAYYWVHPSAGLYVPVTYTAWGLIGYGAKLREPDYLGCQLNPMVFHLANVLLHVLSVLTVYAVLKRLIRSDWPACAGALLFALHPVQVEAVAWVSGLKDLLYGLLSLLAIWQYLKYVETPGPSLPSRLRDAQTPRLKKSRRRFIEEEAPRPTGRRYARLGHYLLATAAFIAAMLSKPTAAMLPLVVFALDYWALKRPWRLVRRSLALWVVLAIPVMWIARVVQDSEGVPYVALHLRPLVAGDALAFYLYKLVCPIWLGVDYARRPAVIFQHAAPWLLWIVPLGLALWLYRWRRRRTWLVAAGIVFVAPLLPTLGLVPFQFQYYSTVADHYLYLAMLGPSLALARVAWRFPHRQVAVACAILFAGLSVRSVMQEGYWRSDRALWTHDLDVNPTGLLANVEHLGVVPQSFAAHIQLGKFWEDHGSMEVARDHYLAAAEINPDSAMAQQDSAIALIRLDDFAGADRHGRQLLRIMGIIPPRGRANAIGPFMLLGEQEARHGNDAVAIPYLREILRLNTQEHLAPAYPQARMELDACEGNLAAASREAADLIALNQARAPMESLSTTSSLGWLGQRLMNQGCYAAAIPCFEEMLRLESLLPIQLPKPGPAEWLATCRARRGESKPPRDHANPANRLAAPAGAATQSSLLKGSRTD